MRQYNMESRSKFFALAATSISLVLAFTSLAFAAGKVHVNQIGFGTTAQKQAVYVNNGATPGTITLQRVDAGQVNQTITLGAKGSWEHSYSTESSYILDFTEVEDAGHYAFFEGNTKISPIFQIGVSYDELTKGALKFFYYHRADLVLDYPYTESGFSRPAGHSGLQAEIYDINGAPTGNYITSYRGWYDAGDYGRYVVNSGISTYTLLALYEKYADKIPTLNIPADQIAGLPLLLSEIKWNLDWMLSMQDASDGGVYHKMTNQQFESMNASPAIASSAPLLVTWKTTAATLDFAAVMAVASRVYRDYNVYYADQMLNAAKEAWDWAIANPAVYYSSIVDPTETGAYEDDDVSDEFFFAAAALATVTSGAEQSEFTTYITNNNNGYYGDGASWASVGSLGTLEIVRNQTSFSQGIYSSALLALTSKSDEYLQKISTGYGLPFDDIFVWGSNSVAANIGIMLLEAGEILDDPQYKDAAQSILDYILGRNPLAQSYVTGFGRKFPVNSHDRLSASYGKVVPAQLVGGPATTGCDGSKNYAAELATKYEDDFDCYGYNEIAINWNSPLAYLLAALSESGLPIQKFNNYETILYTSADNRPVARTGEGFRNFTNVNGSGTAFISNEGSPIGSEGYAEILDVNLYLPDWTGHWTQASIGLKAENNGVSYNLAQCTELKYKYKGNGHRLALHSKDSQGRGVTHYRDIINASVNFLEISSGTYFERDDYDEAAMWDKSNNNNGYINYVPFDWGAVKDINWVVRPFDGAVPITVTGSLQISEIKCLGELDLPSFSITGPANMTLPLGYAASSTDIFNIYSAEDEQISVDVACSTCDGKVAWNNQNQKLDIQAGLPAGFHAVTLTASTSSDNASHLFTLTVEPPIGTFAEGVIWESEGCKDEYGRYLSVNGGFGDGWWYAFKSNSGSGSIVPEIGNNFHSNLCDKNGKVEYDHGSTESFGIGFDLATVPVNIGDKEGVCITYSLEQLSSYSHSLSLVITAEENGVSPTGDDNYSINIPKTNGQEVRKCFIFSEFQQSGWGTIVPLNQVLQNAKALQIKSEGYYATAALDIKKIEWVDVDLDELPPIGTFAENVLWDNENCAEVYEDYPQYLPVNVGYNSEWNAYSHRYEEYGQWRTVSLVPAADDNFHKNLCKSGGNVEFSGYSYAKIGFNLTEDYIDISDEEGICVTYSYSPQYAYNDNDLALEIVPIEIDDESITGGNEYNVILPPTNGQEARKCFALGDFKQRYKSSSYNPQIQYGTEIPLDVVLENAKALQLRMMRRDDNDRYSNVQGNLEIKKIEWLKITLPGKGTEQEPYIITDAEQLGFVARNVNSGKEGYNGSDVYYELGDDIDLSDYSNWAPIGNDFSYWDSRTSTWLDLDVSFKANFDGKGYKIKNLTITSRNNIIINNNSYRPMGLGLFGVVNGTVQNLGLENVNITVDGDGVGGIAGQLWGGGIIRHSYVADGVIKTADTYTDGQDRSYGGIAGKVTGNIIYCYSTADIYVNTSGGSSSIISAGGIAGYVFNDATYESPGSVKSSMALGRIVSNSQTGFAGRIAYGDGILMNNLAFSGILNKDNNTEWNNKGSNKLDGEDREADELFVASGYLSVFTDSPWTYEAGKLPGLNEEPVDMPPHIIIPTDGITKVVIAPKTVDVQRSKTQTFIATVQGFGDYSQAVVTLTRVNGEGHYAAANNAFNATTGVLTVAANETPGAEILIIATAEYNGTTKKDTAIVTVVADPVPPTIQGDIELTLREGYEATSTSAYSITGTNQPITVVKKSGDDKITWDPANNKLDIAVGLTAETYIVELEAEDATGLTSTFTFTLTVLPLPTVTSVTVTPPTATVQKDQSQQFAAVVAGDNDPSLEVTWSVIGNLSAGTDISRDGVLYVAEGETATTLTVRATSVDPSKFGEATVTVTEVPVLPTITGPTSHTLTYGYAATSIPGFALSGTQPITVNVAAPSAYGRITWDGATNSLKIAAGLSVGIYNVVITVSSTAAGTGTTPLQFTLTVEGVKEIEIDPIYSILKKGDTQQFSAIVTAIGGVNEAVTWSVTGGIAATNITAGGLLTVGANETATELTVTARSVLTPEVTGTAIVKIGTAPVVVCPPAMALNVGYAATSSDVCTTTVDPEPSVTITGITPSTAEDKIEWNPDTYKFEIAAGLAAGIYVVEYEAENEIGTLQYTFTLTVATDPTITGPTNKVLPEGYSATVSEEFTFGGTPSVAITTEPSTESITWDADDNRIKIAAGLAAGTYTVTLTATNIAGTKRTHTFELTVTGGVIIAGVPNANTLNARMQNGTLHINGLTAGKTWSIYTISGTLVKQSVASGIDANVNLNIPRGIYIVKSNGRIVRFVNK